AYTGKQYDEATGLQHNWFRWYDPALGQWLSEDPLGFAAGDENVRRYVGNGVVDSIDPTGLQEPSGVLTEEQIRLIQEWIKNNTNASPPNSNVQAPTWLQSLPTPPLPGEPVPDRFGNVHCTGTWPTRVGPYPSLLPQLPQLPESGDVYVYGEIDLTGLLGIEPQLGFVYDIDHPLESGVFYTGSISMGINVGVAGGIGYHSGDLEGWGSGVDVNVPYTPVSLQGGTDFDGNPYGAVSFGRGSGASANISNSHTWQWPVQLVDFVHSSFTIPIQNWWYPPLQTLPTPANPSLP
ncbi:MAG: RHS repeat-associated core domain-containing protein, partial [Planctomycetota bacterium]